MKLIFYINIQFSLIFNFNSILIIHITSESLRINPPRILVHTTIIYFSIMNTELSHVRFYVNKKKGEITKIAHKRIASTLSFLSSSLSLLCIAFFFFPLSPPSVYGSRLPLLICEFLSHTRYPVFSHVSFPSFLLFLVTSHSSARFVSPSPVVPSLVCFPALYLTAVLLPLTPFFSTACAETYFLETSEFICSCPKSLRLNRSSSVHRVSTHEIRIYTPRTYVIREIAFATARTHANYDDDHARP